MNKCHVCNSKTEVYLSGLFDDRYGAKGKHSIYVCKSCGFGRIFPGIKKESIGRFYKKYYPTNIFSNRDLRLQSRRRSRLHYWITGTNNKAHRYVRKGSKVLDVGSAVGLSLLEIKNGGAEAYGVEPDPNAQKFARQYGLNVYKGFITENPFPGIKFDYVTASQVFEHEPEIHKFLESARKKLKKEGCLIMSFPNFDSFLRKLLKNKWIHWHIPYHYNFFTQESIRMLCKKHDFVVKKCVTITPNLWIVLQIRSLLSKRKEGEPNLVWMPRKAQTLNSNKKIYRARKYFDLFRRKTFFFLLYVSYFPIAVIFRLTDSLGLGESTLVFLMKKD